MKKIEETDLDETERYVTRRLFCRVTVTVETFQGDFSKGFALQMGRADTNGICPLNRFLWLLIPLDE